MTQIIHQSSMSVFSCIVRLRWSREVQIPQITCFLMLCLSVIWLSSNPVQVWIFMELATEVPDSSECNQTSHEKTGMCLINQPAPEVRHAITSQGKRGKIEVYYPCTFCICAMFCKKWVIEHISLWMSCSHIMGERERDRQIAFTCILIFLLCCATY